MDNLEDINRLSDEVKYLLDRCPDKIKDDWKEILSEVVNQESLILREMSTLPHGPFWISTKFLHGISWFYYGDIEDSTDGQTDRMNEKIIHTIRMRQTKWKNFLDPLKHGENEFSEDTIRNNINRMIEKPYRPTALLEILQSEKYEKYTLSEGFDDQVIWNLIETLWIESEFNSSNKELWEDIFRWSGKVPNSFLETLPDEFMVYRGGYQNGFSWTLNKEKGQWFAERFGEGLPLWELLIKKEDVLFYTDKRDEQEVIIFPTELPWEPQELDY